MYRVLVSWVGERARRAVSGTEILSQVVFGLAWRIAIGRLFGTVRSLLLATGYYSLQPTVLVLGRPSVR